MPSFVWCTVWPDSRRSIPRGDFHSRAVLGGRQDRSSSRVWLDRREPVRARAGRAGLEARCGAKDLWPCAQGRWIVKRDDGVFGLGSAVVRQLLAMGVAEAVIAAGARNLEVTVAASRAEHFRCWNHFEERCAGFFALGRARASGRPVAVVTTSGTAAAELLPAGD